MDRLHHTQPHARAHEHTHTHTDTYTKPNFLNVIICMVHTNLSQSPIKHSHKMLAL